MNDDQIRATIRTLAGRYTVDLPTYADGLDEEGQVNREALTDAVRHLATEGRHPLGQPRACSVGRYINTDSEGWNWTIIDDATGVSLGMLTIHTGAGA